jgi:hypothetical protein
MARFLSNPLAIASFALLLSIGFNLSAVYVFRHRLDICERGQVVDDSHFSKCHHLRDDEIT